MWRVDLYRTLDVLESAKEERNKGLQQLDAILLKYVADLRGMEVRSGVDRVQCRQFIEEAADLSKHIRQSMTQYDFEWDIAPQGLETTQAVTADQLKQVKIIDSRTGSLLRSSASPIAGPDGRVGELLFVVYPAFVRRATESSQKIVLTRATVVVKFDQPVPRKGKSN
jgi:hypothetical protein